MRDVHEVMRVLGRVARAVYRGEPVPKAVLSVVLTRPAAGLGLMMRRADEDARSAVAELVNGLPDGAMDGIDGVAIEDQGGFWLGWYGK